MWKEMCLPLSFFLNSFPTISWPWVWRNWGEEGEGGEQDNFYLTGTILPLPHTSGTGWCSKIVCLNWYSFGGLSSLEGFPGGAPGNESISQCRRHRFNPCVRKISWRRKWQPTPVFLSGKFHGQKSLAGYSPWGWNELSMTDCLSTLRDLQISPLGTLSWTSYDALPHFPWPEVAPQPLILPQITPHGLCPWSSIILYSDLLGRIWESCTWSVSGSWKMLGHFCH